MKARLSFVFLAALSIALAGCADELFTGNLFKDVAKPAVPDSATLSQMSETDIAKLLNSETFMTELLKAENAANLAAVKTRLEQLSTGSSEPAVQQGAYALLADLELKVSGAEPVVRNLLSTMASLTGTSTTEDPAITEAKKILDSTVTLTPTEAMASASALVNLIFEPGSGGQLTVEGVSTILASFVAAKDIYDSFGMSLTGTLQGDGSTKYSAASETLDIGTLATGAVVAYILEAVSVTLDTGTPSPSEKIDAIAYMIVNLGAPANVASINFDTTVLNSTALTRIMSAANLTVLIDSIKG